MGILLHFAIEGSLKETINNYNIKKVNSQNMKFINFKDYPKFEMNDTIISSTFIH